MGLIENCALILQYTEKLVRVEVIDSQSVKHLVRMAEIFEQEPAEFMTANNFTISPLICGQETGEILLEMAKYGIRALTTTIAC